MIDFGMPTLIELPDIDECAKLCKQLGLQFIELNMCLPQYQTNTLDLKYLADTAKKYNIYYTIHLDDTNTPCDFNNDIALAYTNTVLKIIEISKELNIPILNMHLSLGTYFTLPDRKVLLFEEYKEEYVKKLISFRDKCDYAIGDFNIKICVENTRAFQHNIGEKSLSLLYKSNSFYLTFDTGHDASSNFEQRPIIDKYLVKLAHMHLHDALPNEKRDHLALGSGYLPLYKYIEVAKEHDCRIVLEIKTIEGLKQSVDWINSYAK